MEETMLASVIAPEVESVKTRLKHIWMVGDYDRFSRYMEHSAREFYERLLVGPEYRLLDVGCGSGQLALMAAKDGLAVTGVDIASNWVERARARAQAEGLHVRFEEADAEALPCEDASFDVVASLIGAMFAPRPDLVAKELLRVCKPGGTIAMANWTPRGFIGQMFKIVSTFIAPSGMPSPVLWGDARFMNGSAMASRSSTWSGATVRSVIPFLLRRWWSSSASTTDRSIRRLRLWTPTVVRLFVMNSKRSGLLTIGQGGTARRSSLNIWK
jgi:SAM-dependent methyltransferase